MAIEQINLGTVVQDGADGDVARVAFTKVNANFADLESRKVEKVTGKQLSTEDYTSAEKMKLGGIQAGAQVNTVTSVAGKTGAVALVKGDVGLGNVDNTSDANKPISTATQTALNLKANASTQIIAGTGLTGGGTLDTNRTLTVSYGTTAGTSTQGNDSRLSDAREWSAETVSQAEAEAGTATTRRAWTAQRVRQAIVAWWNGVSSAWGRGFVASADAAAGRTALELGNAATRAVQTSPTDITAGSLMAVGAFGLGGLIDLRGTAFETGTPANMFGLGTVTGFARGGPDGLNIPAITGNNIFGVLSVYGHWPNATGYAGAASREFLTDTGRKFLQTQLGGSWNPWREVFTTGNILGTVSQSAGVPTGAIIERGSNANGEYVKYAGGTLICTNRVTINRVTLPGGKQNNELVPAASFVGVPATYRSIVFYNGPNGGLPLLYTFGTSLDRFVNSGEQGAFEFSWPPQIGIYTANSEVQTLIAIGRWY